MRVAIIGAGYVGLVASTDSARGKKMFYGRRLTGLGQIDNADYKGVFW